MWLSLKECISLLTFSLPLWLSLLKVTKESWWTKLPVEHCEWNLHYSATWPFLKSGRLKEVPLYFLTSVINRIGHFHFHFHFQTLTFKMRPSAQSFLQKWLLFAWEWKTISISKAEHLTSFWYRGLGKLGNGLLDVTEWNEPYQPFQALCIVA